MSESPDKLFCWNFQTKKGGWEKGWGGYSRQTNLHPMDERERNTGGVYIHEDAHRTQMEAAVKRALEGAADCLRELASRFDYDLDDEIRAIRALDPAQFIDGADE